LLGGSEHGDDTAVDETKFMIEREGWKAGVVSRGIILTTGAPNADLGANLPVHAADADLNGIMATAESIVFVIDDDP
jgi:hypothetical protein